MSIYVKMYSEGYAFMKRRLCTLLILFAMLLSSFTAAQAVTPDDWDKNAPGTLVPDHLYSQAAILFDADTGEVLLDKNSGQRMYPASTTKILMLLVALESGVSLDEIITIPEEANQVPKDSSFVPVTVGEEMTFRDLLYGTMINSGNDGANAIAVRVSGSVEAFVARMNERARELGCTDTNFVNPHGYHDDNHYTTAADLAKMTLAAMQNETFREIVSTPVYTMAETSKRKEVTLKTRNALINPDSDYYYKDALGVKTGYHSKAGQCFVSAAKRHDKTLIAVMLHSEPSEATYKWKDARRLFEYGFAQYTPYTIAEMYAKSSYDLTSVLVPNAAYDDSQSGTLNLQVVNLSNEDYRCMVRNSEGAMSKALGDFAQKVSIDLRSTLNAPIDAGEIIGNFSYTPASGEAVTAVLIASRDVKARPDSITVFDVFPFLSVFDNEIVKWAAIVLLIVIVILIVWSIRRSAIRQRRRREIYRIRRKEYERRVRNGEFENQGRKDNAARKKKRRQQDDFFD